MPLVSAKCTNCGASLKVDNTKDAALCEYCNTPFIVEKAINNYNISNNTITNSVVNIYGGNSADFVIRAGVLEKYTGASTEVVIPNSVTFIGNEAFKACWGLTSITISNTVTAIGRDAFSCCSGLTSVAIPNSVTSIWGGTFQGCSGLTSISIPNSVTSIGDCALRGCSGLTSITIPNSVTSIEGHAFERCTGLTSITIPNSVTSIGARAFYGCTGLTSIVIPNGVTSIGLGTFDGCTGLRSITIPNSVTSIPSWAASGCTAFDGCTGLTSINSSLPYTHFYGTPFFNLKREEEKRERERQKGGCYLTTACMEHQAITFDDNCHELTVLRSFRDSYLKSHHPEDIQTYYHTAPAIVDAINGKENATAIWSDVYDELIVPSVNSIQGHKLEQAYTHYKAYSLMLGEKYLKN